MMRADYTRTADAATVSSATLGFEFSGLRVGGRENFSLDAASVLPGDCPPKMPRDDKNTRKSQTKEEITEHVQSEHARWIKLLCTEDPYESNVTIGIREVLGAHFLLAEFFVGVGEGIGGIGPKEPRLLISALGRQFTEFGGKPKWNNRIQIVASLMYGLIKNHPFYDANKRTAFLASILHLQKIGRTPTATDQEYEDFTVDISDDNLGKYTRDGEGRIRDQDRCVEIISEYSRKNTRDIDLRVKQITYNELRGILKNFGIILTNPDGNRIDVMRVKNPITKEEIKPQRIAHIGFHGWSKEVSRKDIHIVRNAAHLDVEHGYDSQAFFNGMETPLSLINKYKEPLKRLAFR